MFVLACRQQEPMIVGIMKAQFIKIDVKGNIAGLEFCWLLWKAALVFYMAEKVIWIKGKHFCIILLCWCCPVDHLLLLYTATEIMKNILQTVIVWVPNLCKVRYKSLLKPVHSVVIGFGANVVVRCFFCKKNVSLDFIDRALGGFGEKEQSRITASPQWRIPKTAFDWPLLQCYQIIRSFMLAWSVTGLSSVYVDQMDYASAVS